MGGIFVRYSQPLLEGQNLGMKVEELLLTKVLLRVTGHAIYPLKVITYWVWWKEEETFTNFYITFAYRLC